MNRNNENELCMRVIQNKSIKLWESFKFETLFYWEVYKYIVTKYKWLLMGGVN